MTDRPIIFSAPMIRALLDGRKTMTRRIIKPQPPSRVTSAGVIARSSEGQTDEWTWLSGDPSDCDTWTHEGDFRTGYVPGDRLWVREAWRIEARYDETRPLDLLPPNIARGIGQRVHLVSFEADYLQAPNDGCRGRLRASFHMPRWASRLTLIVTDVNVERLQTIDEDDARAEGLIEIRPSRWWYAPRNEHPNAPGCSCASLAFSCLWDEIHDAGAWAENPWIVAVSFRVIRANIDSEEAKAA